MITVKINILVLITDDTSNSYKKHPAFTFGSDELTGIWVAKYEARNKKMPIFTML